MHVEVQPKLKCSNPDLQSARHLVTALTHSWVSRSACLACVGCLASNGRLTATCSCKFFTANVIDWLSLYIRTRNEQIGGDLVDAWEWFSILVVLDENHP